MNNKLTKKEELYLDSQEGALAVLMGYLKSERGKIAPSVINKLTAKLNYPKTNKGELVDIAKQIAEDEVLTSLYNKGFERVLKLEDIPNYIAEDGALNEKEVFDQVTNFLVDHEDNNARLRELRKIQRSGVYMEILMENAKKFMVEELKGMPRAKYLETKAIKPAKGDKSLILALSDTHIGALVYNTDTGGYDFDKIVATTQSLVQQTLEKVKDFDIDHVHIYHVGDIIEHISMRNVNQAFESEFPATEQIAKAQRLIADVLIQVSKHVHVTYGMVAGNHDRFEGNKADKIYNDNVAYLILDGLFMLQEEFGQLPNVTLIDNREDTYVFTQEVAGKNVMVRHGDTEKKKDDVKITRHIKTEPIDYLIMGHIHTTRIIQEDYHRFHVYVGSPMGANNFSKELNFPTTAPSQMMIILTEGSNSPMFTPLMDI